MAQTGKITALYCRYSADDNMRSESDSIAHQKAILTEYANNHGLTNQRFYVDDGVSGVTFERAGFKAMLNDIENGIVGTVVVKDMSRFGRNYLMVGQYLEIVFPEYGVRFIAIGDNIDSDKGMSDLMPISNLINEWYARDISRKERAYVQNKGNSGKRITSRVVYGYKTAEDDKEKWVIDEPAAEIVRRIFTMYLGGIGISEIARILTEEKIPRPTAHKGHKPAKPSEDFDEYFWHYTMISSILRRQEYCGDTINFRTTRLSYKSKKVIWNPKEKIRIFYDTQEPIITREQFEEVQQILGEPKKRPKTGKRSMYYGLLFCEACKHTMRAKHIHNGDMYTTYQCSLASKKRGACDLHIISEKVLNEVVLNQINRLIAMDKTDRQTFNEMLRSQSAGISLTELEAVTAELNGIRTRISEIDRFVQGLFESKVKGEIDGDMFCTFSENYRKEKAELNVKLESLMIKEERLKSETNKGVKLGTRIHNYDTISEVTPEVLKDFIDRIEVGEKIGKSNDGRNVRKISVFFIGIGEIFPN